MKHNVFLLALVCTLPQIAVSAVAPVVISTQALPAGIVGTACSLTLNATGGSGPPYAWAILSGSLPPGLSLGAATGVISGTPRVAGSAFTFSVEVADPAGDVSGAQAFSVAIAASTTPTTLTLISTGNPVTYGQPVTLTASVVPGTAAGNVTFYDGIRTLETIPVSGGQAGLTEVLSGSGMHSLHAYFTGLPIYLPSTSATLQQTVSVVTGNDFRAATVDTSPAVAGIPVAVVDLNADGKADIVTTSGVALGNGDGTFRAFNPISGTITSVGDFNGDGRMDLVTSTGILLGNGDGTFQSQILYPAGYGAAVAADDFDGDGIADLAGHSRILRGNGDGTFQPGAAYPTGGIAWTGPVEGGKSYSPASGNLVVGDFNGDGKADLFTVYYWNARPLGGTNPGTEGYGGVALLGNGDGAFQSPPTVASSQYSSPLNAIPILPINGSINYYYVPFFVAGDFDGDGKDDIAMVVPGSLSIYLSNGDGTFRAGNVYPMNSTAISSIISAVTADFNGDGILDLAVPNPVDDAVEVFTGNGDGTFQPGVLWPTSGTGGSPFAALVADFDGDGRPDIVYGFNGQSTSLGLLLGSAPTTRVRITSTSLPPATIGLPYSAALQVTGGVPSYKWTIVSGSLAPGLMLDPAAGVVSGTPGSVGSAFSVSVSDTKGNVAPMQEITISVASPVIVAPQILPAGFTGMPWTGQTLTATGGVGQPYAWAISSGSLPPGLILNSTMGVISGIPANATGSPFDFSVMASDTEGRVSAAQSFSIAIVAGSIPSPQPTGIANAAGLGQAVPQMVGLGAYVAIYGSSLAGTGNPSAVSLPLPTSLNGTQATLGGIPMPLLYAAIGQINALVPQGLASGNSYPLVVTTGALQSTPMMLLVRELQPGIYTLNESGAGQGIVTNAVTGQLISPSNPAHVSDYVVIYCTGLGAVTGQDGEPGPTDGAAAPVSLLFRTTATVTATIGGIDAPVSFSGLTPTLAGLYQVNVQVPAGVTAGDAVPVVIMAADSKTGASAKANNVTVAIQ